MQWRRKNYLIDKDFQFRYIGRIIFSIVVLVLIAAFTVYYTTWARIMDQFYNLPQIASQFAGLFSAVNGSLVFFLLVFLLLIAVVSVFISHAIAGPIYRFQKSLEAIAAGDLSLRIGLRKGDEFKHLAETINRMVSTLRTNMLSDRQLVQRSLELLEQLQPKGKKTKSAGNPQVEELRQVLEKLQLDSQRYKL